MDGISGTRSATSRHGRAALPVPVVPGIHQQVPPPTPPRASPSRRECPQRRPSPPPPTQQPQQQQPVITLQNARHGPRATNEYVENPHVVQNAQNRTVQAPPRTGRGVGVPVNGVDTINHVTVTQPGPQRPPVLTQQPSVTTIKKEGSGTGSGADEDHEEPCRDSIICSQCGKCRCDACTKPRHLPHRWLCDSKYECSPERVVDWCTCMCVMEAVFYHLCKDMEADEEVSASDDPCACCERPHCCKRWTCIGLMSLCLPCLFLYWPLRCGLSTITSCYNRCSRRGCHCSRDRLPGSRRLLIDSESSSA